LPFTISHAAAVLPFTRKKLAFSAMIIGSMAPDFPYFILLPNSTGFGHTLKGLFLFDLPVGLAVLWMFHALWKRPLLSLAPHSLRTRICVDRRFEFRPVPRFAWIGLSLLLGAATHIVWDAFTHRQGFIVDDMPALQMSTPFAHQPIYNLLQLASSVVGLVLLGWAYVRWLRRSGSCTGHVETPLPTRTRSTIIGLAGTAALGFGLCFGYYFALLYPSRWLAAFVVRSIIGTMAAGFLSVLIFSLWWHLRQWSAEPGD
jgi:hypothetical protein